MFPDEWGRKRTYAPSTGVPGPRDPTLTPYMIPWARAVFMAECSVSAIVCGAQMGKTDTQLDIMGERLDNRPTPILYVGPSKEFNEDQFEPRFIELLAQAKSLGAKASKKRQKKTLKRVAGVRVRLAHAGSSTALKSDPAGLALVDEYDEMLRDVRKQGDPFGLLGARGFTYADFHRAVASTPSRGLVESEVDVASGLEFWKPSPPEDLESAIWGLFQAGTMHHWAWPCPHCEEYFIPRMKLMRYPEEASAIKARREAYMECPICSCEIRDEEEGDDLGKTKAWMNARGLYVAPGQWIETVTGEDGEKHGVVKGEPKESDTASFWVSGLASPFVSWGKRVFELVEAKGDAAKEQVAVNAGFGELYAPGGGDIPEWKEVLALKRPYTGVPSEAVLLTAGVDIQRRGIYFVIRAWGAGGTSWKVTHGFLHGLTTEDAVWAALQSALSAKYDGRVIKIAFVDSGFRPGKPEQIPENKVYEFCRRNARFVFPSKGKATQTVPIRRSKIEVNPLGGAQKYGLELMWLDTDYFKSFVHEHLRYPETQAGAFFFDEKTDEDYARQLVSEARMIIDKKPVWVAKSRQNHYLDCEALNAAAGYFLNVHRITKRQHETAEAEEQAEDEALLLPSSAAPAPAPAAPDAGDHVQSTKVNKFAKMAAAMNMRKPT